MITYIKGNLFDSDADCIFNTVNCEGFMGKGIAYQFKIKYPENNKNYIKYCEEKLLRPGVLLPFVENGKTIINFPTKDKWRNPSEMRYIIDGLDEFIRILPELNIRKVAIPPLGCGNGGLKWDEVRKVIEEKLKDCNIDIELYEPATIYNKAHSNQQMSSYDLLILHVRELLNNHSSLRFQKTFYFTNYYSGEKLFRFSRGMRGPYSKELYKASEAVNEYQKNNRISDSKETYNAIYQVICTKRVDSQLKKLTDAVDKALYVVNSIDDDLILEGCATALYLIKDEKIVEKTEIVKAFKEWSDDKAARFNDQSVICCLDKLEYLGIIQRNLFDEYEVLYKK